MTEFAAASALVLELLGLTLIAMGVAGIIITMLVITAEVLTDLIETRRGRRSDEGEP